MKKRLNGSLLYSSPIHQALALQGARHSWHSCICCVCPIVVPEPCLPSIQLSSMALFVYVAGLLHVLMSQSGATLSLSLRQTRHLPELRSHWIAGLSPHVVPWEAFFGGQGLQSHQMSTPRPLLGLSRNGAPCYLPLSLGQESLWNSAFPWKGSLHTAVLVVPLWMESCRVGLENTGV